MGEIAEFEVRSDDNDLCLFDILTVSSLVMNTASPASEVIMTVIAMILIDSWSRHADST